MRTDLGREGCGLSGLEMEHRPPSPGGLDDVVKELHGSHDVLILWPSFKEGKLESKGEKRAFQRQEGC